MIVLRAGVAEAHILPFGATIQSLLVPDRNGMVDDIVLGHDDMAGYLARRSFYGATIGRFANRIAGGRFGDVQAPANDGPNALHGGPDGFDRRVWTVEDVSDHHATLSIISPDGDQGFVGNVAAKLTFCMSIDAHAVVLTMDCEASADAETPVNLTHHGFFNLGGNLRDPAKMRSVMEHELTIHASHYLPVDEVAIPLEVTTVEGTPFDFRTPQTIGERIRCGHPQLVRGKGYDHNFCLDGALAARLRDPVSGRVMEIVTDQPGLQFYSGNFLDGTEPGKGGVAPRMGDALCLEPQLWPDSPNRPDFPDAMLRPGQTYRHRTEFRFTTD
ncbi:aldose epimerase family protein [Falsirhodobacter xinxiangensis]|uniref:aldose epimerase family protein n=1 Tax=Falsirhodobacter xinxiangensis TaxID=2530049 RepID=UPI0010AAF752|nr:aldose epimerase family protein [Rhodobacter xinxiangensis]